MGNNGQFLKVTSIVMVVFAGISALLNFIALLGVFVLFVVSPILGLLGLVATLVSIAMCVLDFFASINGITQKNLALCDKLSILLYIAVGVNFVFNILYSIAGIVTGESISVNIGTTIVSTIIGLIMPTLYFIGCKKALGQPIPFIDKQ